MLIDAHRSPHNAQYFTTAVYKYHIFAQIRNHHVASISRCPLRFKQFDIVVVFFHRNLQFLGVFGLATDTALQSRFADFGRKQFIIQYSTQAPTNHWTDPVHLQYHTNQTEFLISLNISIWHVSGTILWLCICITHSYRGQLVQSQIVRVLKYE